MGGDIFSSRSGFLKHGQLCTGLNKGFLRLNNSILTLADQSSIDTLNTEVNNLKSSVSNGKSLIASAITDKGVSTASDATFQTMANNIRALQIYVPPTTVQFTYTGTSRIRDDGVIELLTSGTFTSLLDQTIDIFLVGGGGGAISKKGNYGSGAGGGGYTRTSLLGLTKNLSYNVTIGAGGIGSTPAGTDVSEAGSGGSTIFGNISVNGGAGGRYNYGSGSTHHYGGNGGSGGGNGNKGGADGGNGYNNSKGSGYAGFGQGTTTREFGEATGRLYADGGSASWAAEIIDSPTGSGGAGGKNCTDGVANTGGGGGACGHIDNNVYGLAKNGGSGIICIRLHKYS